MAAKKKASKSRRHPGRLFDYATGDYVRPATAAEVRASKAAAKVDGGAGVLTINGRRVWAE